jgi:hypothetical protein
MLMQVVIVGLTMPILFQPLAIGTITSIARIALSTNVCVAGKKETK